MLSAMIFGMTVAALKWPKSSRTLGARVQLSVFEAHLEKQDRERLKRRVLKHLDLEADSLRLYPLCAACQPDIEVLGLGSVTEDPEVIII